MSVKREQPISIPIWSTWSFVSSLFIGLGSRKLKLIRFQFFQILKIRTFRFKKHEFPAIWETIEVLRDP